MKRILFFLIFSFTVVWTNSALAKPSLQTTREDTTLARINDNTKQTANNTKKTEIDYVTVIVSVLASIVAVLTWKSQKNTERNTMAIINPKTQEFLFRSQMQRIRDAYVSMFALFFLLRKYEYRRKPSNHFWNIIHINLQDFHEELYYGEEEKFKVFSKLKNTLKHVVDDLSCLRDTVESANATPMECEREFSRILYRIGGILLMYSDALYKVFGYKKENGEIKRFFMNNFLLLESQKEKRQNIPGSGSDEVVEEAFSFINYGAVAESMEKDIEYYVKSIQRAYQFQEEEVQKFKTNLCGRVSLVLCMAGYGEDKIDETIDRIYAGEVEDTAQSMAERTEVTERVKEVFSPERLLFYLNEK